MSDTGVQSPVTDTNAEAHGPIDFLLLEFPDNRPTGKPAAALMDLVDRGVVRVYDLLVLRKDEDGAVSGVEITDLSADDLGGFTAFAGARSGLLGDDDAREAAAAMQPDTMAALLVYENLWAVPFVAAAREAGAQVVASVRISAQDVMDALDALDAVEETT